MTTSIPQGTSRADEVPNQPDPRRFWVFAEFKHHPEGGVKDLTGRFADLEKAKAFARDTSVTRSRVYIIDVWADDPEWAQWEMRNNG